MAGVSKKGTVCGVFCFDPRYYDDISYGFPNTDAIRTQLLIESISELRTKQVELGRELLVPVGKPEEILQQLIKKLNTKKKLLRDYSRSLENDLGLAGAL